MINEFNLHFLCHIIGIQEGALLFKCSLSRCYDLIAATATAIIQNLIKKQETFAMLICLFVLLLYVPVNSYGPYGMVSSPNQTFSWASLNKQLTSTLCTYFRS